MREQQNPSTPELHQPLLFAPSELLACGLRDAHHHPLVGVRTEDGVRLRRWAAPPGSQDPEQSAEARQRAQARAVELSREPTGHLGPQASNMYPAPGKSD